MDIDWAVERIMQEVAALGGVPASDPVRRAQLRERARAVLREWSALGETTAKPRHVTILLSDIRGFTAIAESLSAMAVVLPRVAAMRAYSAGRMFEDSMCRCPSIKPGAR